MSFGEKDAVPFEFLKLVGDDATSLIWVNTARTYYIQSKSGLNKYLKIQEVGKAESLERQAQRLLWLYNKLPVPKVIDFGLIGNYEYLLTLELPGVEASNMQYSSNTEEMISLLAQGLRRIHEVSIKDCPFDHSFEQLMSTIQYKLSRGIKFDSKELHRRFGEDNVEKLLLEVNNYSRELKEDLVFTHGDYSLPNIIIANDSISGFFDLGNCGIAERYYDLAVAEKSIIRNFGEQWVKLFFSSYGVSEIDYAKIRFYQVVEHLVWA
ncbi:APH(3') family aminoglycoside O-phosphotransferase [Paenibacillus sp. FSL R7-0128]|uniref:APH(3') family aminoglycoside O-phosphotransferase n=1 Tax=Paenibacillus sp. FSL R7-0128 TaxID=2954529 RepID=UPI0030FA2A75